MGSDSSRADKINALLRRKLIPQALYHPRDGELHEHRRTIERGEVLDPFEAYGRRVARMNPEERAAYREQTYQEARRMLLYLVSQRPPQSS